MAKMTFTVIATLLLSGCTLYSVSEEPQISVDPWESNTYGTPYDAPLRPTVVRPVQTQNNPPPLAAIQEEKPSYVYYDQIQQEASSIKRQANSASVKPIKKSNIKPQASEDSYLGAQASQLRQELISTGVQVKQSGNELLIILPGKAVFGSNQTAIEPNFEPALAFIAKSIKQYDRTKVRVIGYTDTTGSIAANKELSLRRANSVFNFLRLNGVNINRIVIDGLGPEKPIASNKTALGREQNNRVEISLVNVQ